MEGTNELPCLVSERMVPPTGIDISVENKGPWIEVKIGCNPRTVDDRLMLSREDAERIADELREVAEDVEEQTDD